MVGDGIPAGTARRTVRARRPTLTRRHLVAATLGMAGATATGAGLGRRGGGFADLANLVAAQAGEPLCEPVVWASEDGFLSRELVALADFTRGPGALAYEGGGAVCEAGGSGFSGQVPGPTFLLRPGDRFKLRLVNQLSGDPTLAGQMTNIHVHGLHVSPLGNGDNVFVHVMAGEAFDYEYQIPDDHPTGLFWYHPHFHTQALVQVNAGLAGAIIIADRVDEPAGLTASLRDLGARNPGPPAARHRLLVLQNLNPTPTSDTLLVNGQVRPTIAIAPGEEQRWQILNASAAHYFNISIDGHTMRRIAADGNWIPNYGDLPFVRVLPLGPAERAEVLIRAATSGDQPDYLIRSLRKIVAGRVQTDTPVFDSDLAGGPASVVDTDVIATLTIEAGGAGLAPALPPPLVTNAISRDLVPATWDRLITFSRPPTFSIDRKYFREGRVDQTIEREAAERWRIENEHPADTGWHPFHLHVNDFDVLATSVSPHELQPAFYQDTIPLPPGEPGSPGWVEFSTTFADFAGRFVYHCHLLGHEDLGMMAVVDVAEPVAIEGGGFAPAELRIRQGTTVLWTNRDPASSYTIAADDGSFYSRCIGPRRSFAYTFEVPGEVAYRCVSGDCAGAAPCPATMRGRVVVEAERTVDIAPSATAPGTIELHPARLASPPIAAGTTVVWTNRDSVAHTVSAAGVFASPPIPPGDTYSHTFAAAGRIAYRLDDAEPAPDAIVVEEAKPGVTVFITETGPDPAALYVPPGVRVTWLNRDDDPWSIKTTDMTLDSLNLAPEQLKAGVPEETAPYLPAQRFSHTFDAPRVVSYRAKSAPPAGTAPVTVNATVYVVTEVAIADFAFEPATVEIPVGTTVLWTNRGAVAHTVTADDGAFASGQLAPGDPFPWTFGATGAFPYHCANHPAMTGKVVVI